MFIGYFNGGEEMTVQPIGQWRALVAEDITVDLAVVGEDDQYVVLSRTADSEWAAVAFPYDAKGAVRVAALIDLYAARPEFARIGGDDATSGLDTDHPGVEWVCGGSPSDDPDPGARLAAGGMQRLWVVPSTDGKVVGLLAPSDEQCELGEFVSTEAANLFIEVVDALLGHEPPPAWAR